MNDIYWDDLVMMVTNLIGRGTPGEWANAFFRVASENDVTIDALEAAYDRSYREHLYDRGIDP